MAKRFAVIGLGRFGQKLAVSLEQRGGEVIAIDNDADCVDEVKDRVSVAVQLDCTDKSALIAQGVNQVDVAIVCVGDSFETNVLSAMLLKEIGVKQVYSRAAMGVQTQVLEAIGVDQVIHPEEEVAEKLANILAFKPLIDYLHISPLVNVAQVEAPRAFWNKSISEIQVRKNYGVNVVLVRRSENPTNEEIPDPGTEIREGDILLVVGPATNIERLVSLDK
jgi:trk system potassium uptake protein TrkA